jgi:hypothetical protein
VKSIRSQLSPMLLLLLLSGCGMGYNKTLFMTQSNVGLNVDSQPPTAEISISRSEGVIAPTFEHGQEPSVQSSFQVKSSPFATAVFGANSTFAGGDAALALGMKKGEAKEGDSRIYLSQRPCSTVFGQKTLDAKMN